ncbi:hypothetical protein FSP39_019856 [Pinctada imbricata]|uniref:CN hydrolase domain-containing protein n=1 Tax=Pinctada imbricata TaxID=66713 RepID=A0AA88YXM4_PINIB|nr:hypothetical protein FSP39_019856 [Pinctada imbricata]
MREKEIDNVEGRSRERKESLNEEEEKMIEVVEEVERKENRERVEKVMTCLDVESEERLGVENEGNEESLIGSMKSEKEFMAETEKEHNSCKIDGKKESYDKKEERGDGERRIRLALIQLLAKQSRDQNLQRAEEYINKAVQHGTDMVVLPELFTTELHPPIIMDNREKIPGPTTDLMSSLAKKHGIHLVAGSIPEAIKGDRIYNTCNVFDPNGKIIAQHRKMHMFDVQLGPHLNISESELSDSGNKLTTFHTGCKLQLFLGAFSALKTGPAHWEVVQRARAIDNQVFIATCAPARDDTAHYASWGHSMVVDPW